MSDQDPRVATAGAAPARAPFLMYQRYIDATVRGFSEGCQSIIDVGSGTADYLEGFDWIPRRVALDAKGPYRSPQVSGLKRDFMTYEPKTRFDFAMCLEVLQEVDDPQAFAARLLTMADRVLISVPYKWEAGSDQRHKHADIGLSTMKAWIEPPPYYYVVVTEPLNTTGKGRRLIIYYAPIELQIPIVTARAKLKHWHPQ